MKRSNAVSWLFWLVLLPSLCLPAFSQGARYGDGQSIESTTTIPTVPGLFKIVVPFATINFCSAPANAVPCTNKAQTYTDFTLGVLCPTSTQVVPAGTRTCQSTTDGFGQWGVWAAPGNYEYTVTVNGASSGPFSATLSVSGSSGGTTNNNVVTGQGNAGAISVWTTTGLPGILGSGDCTDVLGVSFSCTVPWSFPGTFTVSTGWPVSNPVGSIVNQSRVIVDQTGHLAVSTNTSAYNHVTDAGDYVFVTTDFTSQSADTSFHPITGLTWTAPAGIATAFPFECHGIYQQNLGAVEPITFGIQAVSVNPTNVAATGKIQTNASVFQAGNVKGLNTTTATQIVVGTPNAITTPELFDLYGFIQNPSNVNANAYQIVQKQGTAASTVTVFQGAYCKTY